MPSPFPGMDPYLERPDRWGGVHSGLIAVLRELLAPQVAPRFFVDSEDTVYILGRLDPGRAFIRPDLAMIESGNEAVGARSSARIAAPMLLESPEWLEVRVPHLTIMDSLDRRVVTTIEVLSPVNKARDSSGRREFLRKREQVFEPYTHWLEIDLLRDGIRPLDVPTYGDYNVVLHRVGTERLAAWFWALEQPLPTIAVPLAPPLEDIPLDLQAAVETIYNRYRYDTAINYAVDPPPPALSAAQTTWARDRIAAWQVV